MGVYKNENWNLLSYDTTKIMWTDHLKIGKVDGETIIADPDGTLHSVTKNKENRALYNEERMNSSKYNVQML